MLRASDVDLGEASNAIAEAFKAIAGPIAQGSVPDSNASPANEATMPGKPPGLRDAP